MQLVELSLFAIRHRVRVGMGARYIRAVHVSIDKE